MIRPLGRGASRASRRPGVADLVVGGDEADVVVALERGVDDYDRDFLRSPLAHRRHDRRVVEGRENDAEAPRVTEFSISATCASRSSSRRGPRQDVDVELRRGLARAGVDALPEDVRGAFRNDGDRQAVLSADGCRSRPRRRDPHHRDEQARTFHQSSVVFRPGIHDSRPDPGAGRPSMHDSRPDPVGRSRARCTVHGLTVRRARHPFTIHGLTPSPMPDGCLTTIDATTASPRIPHDIRAHRKEGAGYRRWIRASARPSPTRSPAPGPTSLPPMSSWHRPPRRPSGSRSAGGAATPLALDVRDEGACVEVARQTGPLDILVNNAGIGHVGTALTTTGADLDSALCRERPRHAQCDQGVSARRWWPGARASS